MSEDAPHYGGTAVLEHERQRLIMTLRQIADHLDQAETEALPDIVLRVSPAAEEFFRAARLLLARPFGQ